MECLYMVTGLSVVRNRVCRYIVTAYDSAEAEREVLAANPDLLAHRDRISSTYLGARDILLEI